MAEEMKEGFLCPICMADLGDVIQLQVHFDEEHSKEDPAVVKNLKEIFGRIKKGMDVVPRLASSESASEIVSILSPSNNQSNTGNKKAVPGLDQRGERSDTVNVYGTEYEASFNPVSGISTQHIKDNHNLNKLPSVSKMAAFRQERSRRADMLAMDTNKLVIRLEKLMTSLPVEPIKRRAHEQAVVPWVPEDVVKLCPNCAKSFNLTRRKHHCRLCGSIMCNDCSDFVDFGLARKLVNQSVMKENEGTEGDATKQRGVAAASVEELASKMFEYTGLTEAQSKFRTCTYCLETLRKREARIRIKTEHPPILFYYTKLRELMDEGAKMSSQYQAMAAELNAGDSAQTKHKIDDAKVLRLKLLKMAETVDAVSKRIAGLELVVNEDQDESVAVVDPVTLGSYTTLKSRIRMASVNFVKETLVGLPGIPTEEELSKLQENRQKEASLRVEEEKRQKARAQIKFDSSAKKQQRSGSEEGVRQSRSIQPVKFDNGFVSSLSGVDSYVSSDDPIVQQMCNLREFISQARSAGRHDDASILEDNLKDLQQEYQKQRAQLEDNYESYRHIFEPSRSTDASQDGGDSRVIEGDGGSSNPFDDATEEEIASMESALDNSQDDSRVEGDVTAARPKSDQSDAEVVRQTIGVGSADFDEYDASGKNPFF